jgi:hypothetical protein
MALTHNKKRNPAIVYRQLIKCMSEAVVRRNEERAQRTMKIVRRYFSKGCPLAEELELYKAVERNRGIDEGVARRILSVVLEAAGDVDQRTSDIKKSNLIKEINYGLGKDFFDRYRVPEYRAFASVNILINSQGKKVPLNESTERAKLEESVVRYMTTAPTPSTAPVPIDQGRDDAALDQAVESFNREYASLDESQKALIDAYVVGEVRSDFTRFDRLMEIRLTEARAELESYLSKPECKNDAVLEERVRRVVSESSEVRSHTREEQLEEILLLQSMVKEMKSDA